jgi:hypothetical protein
MTTPKTKTTKSTKTKGNDTYIQLVKILAEIQEDAEDHGNVLDNHSEVMQEIQDNQDTLFSNDEIIADKLNGIFWMCLIGVGVAITFAFIALFR